MKKRGRRFIYKLEPVDVGSKNDVHVKLFVHVSARGKVAVYGLTQRAFRNGRKRCVTIPATILRTAEVAAC